MRVLNPGDWVGGEKAVYVTEGMTYAEFKACVKLFAEVVKTQCFRTKYQPRSFT